MSIEPGKPYRIMNKMAGLALDISKRDHKSIIGKYVEPVDSQMVRIACPFDSFYQCTHIILVDHRTPTYSRGVYQIKGNRTIHWI